jgi:alpha-L-rhamnosidase
MMTIITNLRCEYRENPLGIDITQPRFSWKMKTDRRGAKQSAYHVLAASTQDQLTTGQANLWDSGKVTSDQSVHVVYAGEALKSRQRVYWKVTVWDETGASSASDIAWFEMGLLDRNEWQAEWIGGSLVGGKWTTIPVPYLRKPFAVQDEIKLARLYVTALGVYECSINGQIIGDDVFNPGWTDYSKRIQYNVYDVTDTLQNGDNVIAGLVGDGWATGSVGMDGRQIYVDRPRFFAQLEITLQNGTQQIIVTDDSWKHQHGALLESDMQAGESYDARLELTGWDSVGYDDSDWLAVEVHGDTGANLVATNGPTVKRFEELSPISDPDNKGSLLGGRYIFDLGQNMVGWVRLKGSAPAGTTAVLRFAEVLNPDGSIYTTNLRGARATDHYTFKGEGEEVWEPKFTFHGFRYVELSGYTGEVSNDTITGIVVHSDMAQTGDFSSSDPLLNQLQHNILWGQKGNFVDVPTDCPQRDERLGWTGDIQVFAQTAAYNMDVAGFMTKWANDVADSQNDMGMIPAVVPNALPLPDGGPAWSDAVIICPWTMYLAYGDTRILADNYNVMTRFVDYLLDVSPNLIRCAPDFEGWPGFGDWLSINAPTPRDLVGTAFLAYDALLMSQIAEILGISDDVEKYQQLFADTKQAFQDRYLKGSVVTDSTVIASEQRQRMDGADAVSQGNLKVVEYEVPDSNVFNTNLFNPTQTSYVLALHFDLLPESLRSIAVDELVADIERRSGHLSTGFVGSPYLPHVLSKNGRLDDAYKLLYQKTWPSWLYAVTQGATTIWERWDGWTEDNGFQDPGMNSFNHYAYGAIGTWLYTTVAGIETDPQQAGYKHIIIRPRPNGSLTHAKGSHQTLYGEVLSEWTLDANQFTLNVTIPPNTSATVYLPVDEGQSISLDEETVTEDVHSLDAGIYKFVVG